MIMGRTAEKRVYRPSRVLITIPLVAAVVVFLIGLGLVVGDPDQVGRAPSVAIGAFVMLIATWLGAVWTTSRLIVTPAGLVSWRYLRRRSVGWPEIRSFGVTPGSSLTGWPALYIGLSDGSMLATCVSSFAGRYPARVAEELATLHRELGPTGPAGGEPRLDA
jgi:hypothetical protein